jgi:hypothetical protein
MQEFIVNETKKIFNKAIKRNAKTDGIEEANVSILLHLFDEGEVESSGEVKRYVGYKICHNYAPVKSVGIMDILGVKIDFKGYSMLVPPQIKNILENFELETGSKDIEVGVYLDREDSNEINYFLFKNGQVVKKFNLEEVLNLQIDA